MRPGSATFLSNRSIAYEVQVLSGDADGVLSIRNARGRLVNQVVAPNPCAGVASTSLCLSGPWDASAPPVTAGGRPLPTGAYTATFDMPDQWGRIMRVTLPPFTIQRQLIVHSPARAPASRIVVDDDAVTGRCSRFRAHGAGLGRGSVSLRSQVTCRSHRAGADRVTRVLQLGTPLPDAIEWGIALDVRTTYSRPRPGGRVAMWARVRAMGTPWVRLNSHFRPARRGHTVNGTISTNRILGYRGQPVQIRVRVSRGARLDLGRIVVDPSYLVRW